MNHDHHEGPAPCADSADGSTLGYPLVANAASDSENHYRDSEYGMISNAPYLECYIQEADQDAYSVCYQCGYLLYNFDIRKVLRIRVRVLSPVEGVRIRLSLSQNADQ